MYRRSEQAAPHMSLWAAFVIATVVLATLPQPSHAQIQTVLQKDSPAPGGNAYRKFRLLALGDGAGQNLAFTGTAKGIGGSVKGVYTEESNPLVAGTLIAQKGTLAALGLNYRNFKRPSINASNDVGWFAFLNQGQRGVFRTIASPTPVVIAVLFDVTPLGGMYDDFDNPVLTDSGALVFWAEISGGSSEKAVIRCSGGDSDCRSGSGTMDALVEIGDSVGGGRELCDLNETVNASDWGIAFSGETKLNCLDIGEPALDAVFRKPFAGGIVTLALEGDSVDPVLGVGMVYDRFRDAPSIEDNGIVAFRAVTVGATKEESLFLCDPGSCPASPAESIVVKGQDDGSGNTMKRLAGPAITDAGDVFFGSTINGVLKGSSIYARRSGGSLDRLVTKGEVAPDNAPSTFKRVRNPHVSPGGKMAFRSKLKGIAPNSGNALFLLE